MPKVDSNYIFLVVILIGFVFKKDEVFLKECKYIEKRKKVWLDMLPKTFFRWIWQRID